MKTIAIIPARGGSKRIPKKNIKDFLGKPIITYSIQTALESKLFDKVIVSTDDEEIAEISIAAGAEVPFFRSEKNSDSFATTSEVLIEVGDMLAKAGQQFDFACCVYPTAPFTRKKDLKAGMELLIAEHFDTVFPTVKFDYSIWRSLKLEGVKAQMIWPDNKLKRSQDLESTYHDAGQWYWFRPPLLKKSKHLFTDNSGVIVLPSEMVQDIDTLSDWKIAELKYQLLLDQKA